MESEQHGEWRVDNMGSGQRRRGTMRTGNDEMVELPAVQAPIGRFDLRLDCGLKNLCLPVTV